MTRTKLPFSHLEALPRDVISKILSNVGQTSRETIKNCMVICEELAESGADFQVFKTLELCHLVRSPLLAVGAYTDLMDKCLQHSNPSAQYVKGLLEYFLFHEPIEGLNHLKEAADANDPINEAVYLYGMIKFCTSEFDLGKHYMDKLGWRKDKTVADQCWKNIKIAVHGIGIIRKPEYLAALWTMIPPYECNLNDMGNTCEKCYHYKQMIKFVYTM